MTDARRRSHRAVPDACSLRSPAIPDHPTGASPPHLWKWLVAADAGGARSPLSTRNDLVLLEPALAVLGDRLLLRELGLGAYVASGPRRGPVRHGLCWSVERTNAWLAARSLLRRNTERQPRRRAAWLALTVAFAITVKLVDGARRRAR